MDVMFDATHRFDAALTAERLFGWHAALFPTGRSGLQRIAVGLSPRQPIRHGLARPAVLYGVRLWRRGFDDDDGDVPGGRHHHAGAV